MLTDPTQISISLIIPTYNRAYLIKETIDSALRQIQPFAEIIVVNDGSTDNTLDVLAEYGNKIKVISSENRGVQSARNIGVEIATSQYVALCDSDDLLEAEFVKTMSEWFSKNDSCNSVYINFCKFTDMGTERDQFALAPPDFFRGAKSDGTFLYDIPDFYVRTISYQPLGVTGFITRKAFYESIGGSAVALNGVCGEDWEFTLRVIAGGGTAFCTECLARVRRHAGNDSFDDVRMKVGTAQILEYALRHHEVAKAHEVTILESIKSRRTNAAIVSFSQGNFDVASQLLLHRNDEPVSIKIQIKKFIVRLPEPLRTAVWKMTQLPRLRR